LYEHAGWNLLPGDFEECEMDFYTDIIVFCGLLLAVFLAFEGAILLRERRTNRK